MMSENKVGTYRFVAEPFHCDFSGKLTMSVLGNHLLNCAGFHAADRGFGIATLNMRDSVFRHGWRTCIAFLQTVILQFWIRKEKLSDTPVPYGR